MNELECNDALAAMISDLIVSYNVYFRIRQANDPAANKQMKKCAGIEKRLRKFLADRAAMKAMQQILVYSESGNALYTHWGKVSSFGFVTFSGKKYKARVNHAGEWYIVINN